LPDNSTWFPKQTNINFTVKNLSPSRLIHIFNYPLFPGQTRDLLAIPEISEGDIRHSLIKGELANFLRMKVVGIVSSTIDLLQLDASQAAFIVEGGYIPTNLEVPAKSPLITLSLDSRTIYVSKSGSDTSGNGSQLMPFFTVSFALTQVNDASQTRPHEIRVGTGNYTEDLLIKPWVGITGAPATSAFEGPTTITVNSIDFDPSFQGLGFNVAWLSHLTFNNAPTFNFANFSALDAQLTFFDCLFNSGATYVGAGSGNVNNINWDDCLCYGEVFIQDCQYFFLTGGSLIQITGGGNALDVTSTVEATTLLALQCAINGNINLHTPALNPLVAAELVGCAVAGNLILNGNVSYTSTADGIPSSITLMNSAPPPVLSTKANAIGYVAASSANWNNSAPTSIASALDRIAAKIGPIS
jgi:hypothetical protein